MGLLLFHWRRFFLISAILLVSILLLEFRHKLYMKYNFYASATGLWHTSGGRPPTYTALKKWEAALPQHDLSLPFPEGKTGRYVKFSNQIRWLGWNNCFNEVLMNAHLAYVSGRAYVFQDYVWAHEHYQWPQELWPELDPRTPLPAIVSGPVAGGPFALGDPAPRAVSHHWFDVVCPLKERRIINTRDVKPAVATASGSVVLAHWAAVLRSAPERCVEVVGAPEDPFSQVFDLPMWTDSARLLPLWPAFSASPISRLLRPAPIVAAAAARNYPVFLPAGPRPPSRGGDPHSRMLAMHVRRGDYEKHCRYLASVSAPFYGWNALPLLLDAYVPEPDAADKEERFLARCWPDVAGIVATAGAARRDYAAHVNAHGNGNGTQEALDVFYLLTNDNSAWLGEVKRALRKDGWAVVATSRDLVLDAEQKDVSMAVDMEIARRAAVFVGNGWSSFTSNVAYQRLVDERDPITIRFS